MDQQVDVIIIGVGAMGSAAADHLARRGKSVLAFEQFALGHDLGSSHGGSRIIRQSYFEHPDYVPLLRRAYELFDDLNTYHQHLGGTGLFFRTGGLYLGPEASATFAGSRIASQLHHLPHEILTAAEVTERFPHLTPHPDDLGLYEDNAGYVVPEETIRTQVHRARVHGADIRDNDKVLSFTALPAGGVEVRTESGHYTAKTAVVTAGAWAAKLLHELKIPLVVERQVMHWYDVGADYPHYAAGPVYIHEDAQGTQIYGFPAIDGPAGGGKVAFFRAGRPSDPDALDRDVTAEEKQALATHLQSILPALGAGASLQAKACMYTTTPDNHFVIGRHPRPEQQDIILACGFSGHGFKFTPVIGELIANMVQSGTQTCGVPLFDPLRFSEVRTAASVSPLA